MQRSALCRSRRDLSNEYLLAEFGFDTAEKELCEVCPLSAYSITDRQGLRAAARCPARSLGVRLSDTSEGMCAPGATLAAMRTSSASARWQSKDFG